MMSDPSYLHAGTTLAALSDSGSKVAVILPVTDPCVVHHGALGSFATVDLGEAGSASQVAEALRSTNVIELVLTRSNAAQCCALPPDRIGDLVVVADHPSALGTRMSEQDVNGLTVPLRPYGGLSEQKVPLRFIRLLERVSAKRRPRNFDSFSLALNHIPAMIS